MLAIRNPSGVGKTALMLQLVKFQLKSIYNRFPELTGVLRASLVWIFIWGSSLEQKALTSEKIIGSNLKIRSKRLLILTWLLSTLFNLKCNDDKKIVGHFSVIHAFQAEYSFTWKQVRSNIIQVPSPIKFTPIFELNL